MVLVHSVPKHSGCFAFGMEDWSSLHLSAIPRGSRPSECSCSKKHSKVGASPLSQQISNDRPSREHIWPSGQGPARPPVVLSNGCSGCVKLWFENAVGVTRCIDDLWRNFRGLIERRTAKIEHTQRMLPTDATCSNKLSPFSLRCNKARTILNVYYIA